MQGFNGIRDIHKVNKPSPCNDFACFCEVEKKLHFTHRQVKKWKFWKIGANFKVWISLKTELVEAPRNNFVRWEKVTWHKAR